MELLITGGNGLLGHHLIEALHARGDRPRVLALPGENTSWLEKRSVPVFRGDVCQPDTLGPATIGADAVVHLAGMMGLWRPYQDYHDVNVSGTENVCRTAIKEGVGRVVHVSSWTVYGMDLGQSCDEECPLRPFPEPYALTKAAGDQVVQRLIAEEGLNAVIVRPGTFFGPEDRLHFGRIADRLASRKAVVVGKGGNALPFVYVTDVVQGLLLALDHPEAIGQAFNITNDQPLTQQEFMDFTASEIGAEAPRIHVPYKPLYAAGHAAERVAGAIRMRRQPPVTRLGVKLFGTDNRHSIHKARRMLGFEPRVTLREGIQLAADWYLHRQPVGA
ncbi:MAG TPA: NAD-dependent epimerase/dehydratase family protein [Acidimicrobiales bacterium]|nr:NAD-dependent epimerase/dehydratase family protein [Acidimicrobiales bacterium]